MQSKVSVRGQTVIPKELREKLNITRGMLLEWKVQDGVIVVEPIPADPIQASFGILKGKGPGYREFMRIRREERRRERELEKRDL